MKKFLITIISLLSIFAVVSCAKDNYKTITEEEFVEKANKLDTNPYKYAKGEYVIETKEDRVEFIALFTFNDGLWVMNKNSLLSDVKEALEIINNFAITFAQDIDGTRSQYTNPELEFGIWNNSSLSLKLKGTAGLNYGSIYYLAFVEFEVRWDKYGLLSTYNEVDEMYRKGNDSTAKFEMELKSTLKFTYSDTKFTE